jgi:hypothetical protein
MDEDDLDAMFGSTYHLDTTPEQRAVNRLARKNRDKEQLKQYPHLRCYQMSEEEADLAAEFWDEHECRLRGKYRGATGGGNDIIFSPCSIGVGVTVRCACGAEKDVTDYSSW